MRITDLRKGNYVDVLLGEAGIKTRCEILDINEGDCVAKFKDLGNDSEFIMDTADKWKLVNGVPMTDEELRKLGFSFDPEKSVFALPDKGAWVKGNAIVQKYKGTFDLLISDLKPEAFYGCRAIHVTYVHLLQNAVAKYLGVDLKYT